MAVSKRAIVDAAIEILNRDGVDGLSMRTIAKALNVKVAALYNHVSGKSELNDEIVEYMCKNSAFPEPTDNQEAYLMAMCRAYRAMLLTVRDSTSVFENSIPTTPRRVEIIHLMGSALLALGVKFENLMTVSNMINNYVLSFTADEVRFKHQSPEAIQNFATMLSFEQQPLFISERGFDEQFDYGLRVLFTGLKSEE